MALFSRKPKETVVYQKGIIKIVEYDKPQEYEGKEYSTWVVIGETTYPIDTYKDLGKYVYLKEPATSGKRTIIGDKEVDTTIHHTRILDVEDGFPLCEDPAQVRIYKDAFIVRNEILKDGSGLRPAKIISSEEIYTFDGKKIGPFARARDSYWFLEESSYLRDKFYHNDQELKKRRDSYVQKWRKYNPGLDERITKDVLDLDYYSDESILKEGLLAIEEKEGKCYYVDGNYQRIDNNEYEGAWQFGFVPGIAYLGHGYLDHEGYSSLYCGECYYRFDYISNQFEVGELDKIEKGLIFLKKFPNGNIENYVRDLAGNIERHENATKEFRQRAADLYAYSNGEMKLEDLNFAYFADDKFVHAVKEFMKKNLICSVVDYDEFIKHEDRGQVYCTNRVLFKDIIDNIFYDGVVEEDIERSLFKFFDMTEEQAEKIAKQYQQNMEIIQAKIAELATENE